MPSPTESPNAPANSACSSEVLASPTQRIELLAPAGDWDCAKAAIENGADAVYFGLDLGFNARARATNIALATLPEFMAMLHRRGVRGYLALNTLVFAGELAEFESTVRAAVCAGVDAVLVQDLGAAGLARAICPQLPLHASTQMTLTSAVEIEMAASMGIERVVLPRELSIDEIRSLRRATDVPLEVFVHGALCVAYSGQCLTSESLGGRSANRGQCAQACRLPYELICDGAPVDLGEQKYLLSPQDLAAYDLVPELVAAGVAALKIEGRLKTAEYVANITQHYRRALDAAQARQPLEWSAGAREEMELSFSRGFSVGWLRGCDHKQLVPGLSSAKRGLRLGTVTRVGPDRAELVLERSVRRGDGLVFAGSRVDGAAGEPEQGGRVYEILNHGRSVSEASAGARVELLFAHGAIQFRSLAPGRVVWKTDDPQLNERLRKTYQSHTPQQRTPIWLGVVAAAGAPLVVRALIGGQVVAEVASAAPLAEAQRHPLSVELLERQFSRLGGTGYRLESLQAEIAGRPMAPLSVLGALRHALVDRLDAERAGVPHRHLAEQPTLARVRPQRSAAAGATHSAALRILCRSPQQLQVLLELGTRQIIADFMDIRDYGPAVASARQSGAQIYLAPPRIEKPGERAILRALVRHAPDGILVRNLAGIAACRAGGMPFTTDYGLNVTNELSAQHLIGWGAERVTASYDLNRDQLLDLVDAAPPEWFEVVLHQQMPMFHMEHCVYCAVLSPGKNKHDCGRPCDTYDVRLRDRLGVEHPLRADVGCRNTLYNATPQSAAEAVPALLERGVRNFRVELLDDRPAAEVKTLVELYQRLLAGRISGREVWSRLSAANRVGVTRGTLEARRNPLAIL